MTNHQIFISYASEDRERAGRLAHALEAEGLTVWWDRKIVPGRQFDRAIEKALDGASCVLVCWTTSSVASEWVRNEAAAGAERDVLVPVRLDDVKLPLEFRRRQTVDLVGWNGERDAPAFAELLHAIRGLVDGRGSGETSPSVAATAPASSAARSRRSMLVFGSAAAAGAAGVGIAWWRPWVDRPYVALQQPSGTSTNGAEAAAGYPTVAVLDRDGSLVARALLTPGGYALAMKHSARKQRVVRLSWPEGASRRQAVFEPVRDDRIRGEVILLKPRDEPLGSWPLRVRISRTMRVGDSVERFAGLNDRAPGTVKELFATRTVHDGRGQNEVTNLIVTSGIAAPGDSGAPVVDDTGAVVGLLYGGTATESVVLPIEDLTISFPEAF